MIKSVIIILCLVVTWPSFCGYRKQNHFLCLAACVAPLETLCVCIDCGDQEVGSVHMHRDHGSPLVYPGELADVRSFGKGATSRACEHTQLAGDPVTSSFGHCG